MQSGGQKGSREEDARKRSGTERVASRRGWAFLVTVVQTDVERDTGRESYSQTNRTGLTSITVQFANGKQEWRAS